MIQDELRHIAGEIAEEIDGAEHYMHEAMRHKDKNPNTSKRYSEMAEQEAGHAQNLYSIGLALAQASEDQTAIDMWTMWSKPMLDDALVKIGVMMANYKA